jgi:hypothetical protein
MLFNSTVGLEFLAHEQYWTEAFVGNIWVFLQLHRQWKKQALKRFNKA